MDSHMLFLKFSFLHTCYWAQNQLFLTFYQNPLINFRASNLYGRSHFNEYIQSLILTLNIICRPVFLEASGEILYNQRAHHLCSIPWLNIALIRSQLSTIRLMDANLIIMYLPRKARWHLDVWPSLVSWFL